MFRLVKVRRFGSELDRIATSLERINHKLENFISHTASVHEVEITEAVKTYLQSQGYIIYSMAINQKIYRKEEKGVLCEIDGLLELENGFAVCEAKNTVSLDAIKQLERISSAIQCTWNRPVLYGFLGGPCFPAIVRNAALDYGYGVVELSGDRYKVFVQDKKLCINK